MDISSNTSLFPKNMFNFCSKLKQSVIKKREHISRTFALCFSARTYCYGVACNFTKTFLQKSYPKGTLIFNILFLFISINERLFRIHVRFLRNAAFLNYRSNIVHLITRMF